ncbi:hypothetical protein AcV7_006025 [Taiwanofungus camphoratus]|nr:hypothetical protein AcV7_006025 [Antrodia cinnamomea]
MINTETQALSFGNVNDIKASFENSKSPAISKNPGRLHNDGEHPDTIMQSKAVRRFAPVLGHTHRERERERERSHLGSLAQNRVVAWTECSAATLANGAAISTFMMLEHSFCEMQGAFLCAVTRSVS